MFMVKYLVAFVFGLFIGWITFSPEEEPEKTVVEPEVIHPSGMRSPLFRAASQARTSNNKELN